MQVCGDAGLQICKVAAMQLGDGRVYASVFSKLERYRDIRLILNIIITLYLALD